MFECRWERPADGSGFIFGDTGYFEVRCDGVVSYFPPSQTDAILREFHKWIITRAGKTNADEEMREEFADVFQARTVGGRIDLNNGHTINSKNPEFALPNLEKWIEAQT